MHRTGLTYQQLLDLLDTEFIHVDTGSSHGVHVIASAVTTDLIDCNYNTLQLAHLNLPTLQRIAFFVRLWRKLGWSMREVDRYLVSPAQALAYKTGQLEILRLRSEAREKLGERFDIRKFHDEVLKNGAVALPVLKDEIEGMIAAGR